MRNSIKNKVINYYNSCLLGECGYLLTKDCIYQYVGYAETEDELILDVYKGLPVKFWETRHHIKKSDIIGHFNSREELFKFVEDKQRLLDLQKTLIQNTRFIDFGLSEKDTEDAIKEIKEKLKNKDFGSIDYTNPGLPINPIYMPKKYLKWEDLIFTYDKQIMKVKLNDEDYTVVYFKTTEYYHRSGSKYVGILKDNDIVVYSLYDDSNFVGCHKKFFNSLHLEVVE